MRSEGRAEEKGEGGNIGRSVKIIFLMPRLCSSVNRREKEMGKSITRRPC